MSGLDEIRMLHRLQQIARSQQGLSELSRLEQEFLRFTGSKMTPRLNVTTPNVLQLSGTKLASFQRTIESLGLPQSGGQIDISGYYRGCPRHDLLLFATPAQVDADNLLPERAGMIPLLQHIYIDGFQLLHDFTLHECLIGQVTAYQGNTPIPRVLERRQGFTPGPYRLVTDLDTPNGTVRDHRALHEAIAEIMENPKRGTLDQERVGAAIALSAGLRRRIGAPGRYTRVDENRFETVVNSWIATDTAGRTFHLYARKTDKNLIVRFHKDPAELPDDLPKNLLVIDGNQGTDTLRTLVLNGLYDLSEHVLEDRLTALKRAIGDSDAQANLPDASRLIGELEKAQTYFLTAINPDIRREYAQQMSPEALSCVAHPASDDPVLHALLPSLSWSTTIRQYHDTAAFRKSIEDASDETRAQLLGNLARVLPVTNEQNRETNYWLHQAYRTECERAGFTFEME